jgi:hypothetical protein
LKNYDLNLWYERIRKTAMMKMRRLYSQTCLKVTATSALNGATRALNVTKRKQCRELVTRRLVTRRLETSSTENVTTVAFQDKKYDCCKKKKEDSEKTTLATKGEQYEDTDVTLMMFDGNLHIYKPNEKCSISAHNVKLWVTSVA